MAIGVFTLCNNSGSVCCSVGFDKTCTTEIVQFIVEDRVFPIHEGMSTSIHVRHMTAVICNNSSARGCSICSVQ